MWWTFCHVKLPTGAALQAFVEMLAQMRKSFGAGKEYMGARNPRRNGGSRGSRADTDCLQNLQNYEGLTPPVQSRRGMSCGEQGLWQLVADPPKGQAGCSSGVWIPGFTQKPFTGGDHLAFDDFAAALLYDTQVR